MKTTITGTLEEWMAHDPNAMLINRKINFMSNGCFVMFPQKFDEPIPVTYNSIYRPDDYNDDYAKPTFTLGGCPYIIKANHQYFVSVNTIYGSGVPIYPIAKADWEDPNWEKIDKPEDSFV